MKKTALLMIICLVVSVGMLSGCQNTPPQNRAPTADFTYAATGRTVEFTDTSSDPDGDALSYQWDFGDGAVSTLKNPLPHTYGLNGTYLVTLNVTDGKASNQKEQSITVTQEGSPVNHLPNAMFTYTVNQTTRTVTFRDQSTDEDNDVLSYRWNFGDGSATDESNPVHTYAEDTVYTVTLTVSDAAGNDTESKE